MSLNEKIRKMLFEDTWNKYGSEYMSHPIDQQPQLDSTIQPELPISPSAQASMQLADTAPPVDDESYVPVNNKELSNALAALALKVPDGFVENLYRQIRTAVMQTEMLGDPSAAGEDVPDTEDFEEEFGTEEMDEEIVERFNRLVAKMVFESRDDDDETDAYGNRYDDDDEDWDAGDDEAEAAPERDPTTIQGKYLAQYWRERPGKDPAKFKGSGESTMVNATGRLLQNVVRPLIDVPKDQLSDATEYLRLQFRMLTKDREEEIPKTAPRTFSGMYLKKLVPKLDDSQLGTNFLNTVVTDFKRRNKRWLKDLVDASFAEVESEKAANAKLRATLEKEAPKQAELLDALGG